MTGKGALLQGWAAFTPRIQGIVAETKLKAQVSAAKGKRAGELRCGADHHDANARERLFTLTHGSGQLARPQGHRLKLNLRSGAPLPARPRPRRRNPASNGWRLENKRSQQVVASRVSKHIAARSGSRQ